MIKKIKIKNGILILGLICASLPFAVNAKQFDDVNANVPQAIAIDELSDLGVIKGYEDGMFRPNQTIIRAEALKVILLAFDVDLETATKTSFNDVNEADWFYEFVNAGNGLEIVKGYEDGSFKPGQVVNLAESLKMALKAAARDTSNAVSFNHPDLETSAWYKKNFDYALENNLLGLDVSGRLNPGQEMSRAEFVELIYRIKQTNGGKKFDISYNWKEKKTKNGVTALYPIDWQATEIPTGLILSRRDASYSQSFIAHTYPNSAHMVIEILEADKNLSAKQILKNLELEYVDLYSLQNLVAEQKQVGGREVLSLHVPTQGVLDYFMALENGMVIAAQASYGEGLKKADFIKTIYHLQKHIDYKKPTTVDGILKNLEADLSQARLMILQEDKGDQVLDLFSDAVIFETDVIGVGTGPVDYYYSEEADITIKYERSTNIVLDIQESKTSAF